MSLRLVNRTSPLNLEKSVPMMLTFFVSGFSSPQNTNSTSFSRGVNLVIWSVDQISFEEYYHSSWLNLSCFYNLVYYRFRPITDKANDSLGGNLKSTRTSRHLLYFFQFFFFFLPTPFQTLVLLNIKQFTLVLFKKQFDNNKRNRMFLSSIYDLKIGNVRFIILWSMILN